MDRFLPYWHVDAFAARPFAGNQAAVMILPAWLPDDALQAIAAENNFAETAFVVRDATGGADWLLRWFTPACEVRLCGHATLASGHVLLTRDGGEQVRFATRQAGMLEVRRSAAGYELALPAIPAAPFDWPDAGRLLGAEPALLRRNPDGYTLALFEREEQVLSLRPDFRALAGLGADQFICTAPGSRTDIVSRVFVPGAGVDEDSVTGSAHAVLAPFWAERLGQSAFSAHQASHRGGDMACRVEGDRVWLGGPCVTVVEGRFYLPG